MRITVDISEESAEIIGNWIMSSVFGSVVGEPCYMYKADKDSIYELFMVNKDSLLLKISDIDGSETEYLGLKNGTWFNYKDVECIRL